MAGRTNFLKQFWSETKMVGSIFPSSIFLAKLILKNINFQSARVIVELGPGTGIFTKKILEKMHPDALLFVFELNDSFYTQLKSDLSDPRVILIHDSAEFIQKYLNEHNLLSADYIISSLPYSNFPDQLKNKLIDESYQSLKSHGKYIQFQYSLKCKPLFEEKFQDIKIDHTLLNLPPAYVYTCEKSI